jgi:hypothetical protein
MTMKLIDILNEETQIKREIKGLTGVVIPFEYGTVMFHYMTHDTEEEITEEEMSIVINIDKFRPDMFDKAYLAFSQKIQSLYGNQYDMSRIKLKCDGVYLDMKPIVLNLSNYLSVATKNTLRYDKPSVEKILKGGYHVEVNMDLLPHISDDMYDIIKKKEEHSKMVFEFLQDGTLNNGTSYKLIFIGDDFVHDHKESSGRHLDYSDININIYVEIDKDFPLTTEEKDEVKKKFKMYDVILFMKRD